MENKLDKLLQLLADNQVNSYLCEVIVTLFNLEKNYQIPEDKLAFTKYCSQLLEKYNNNLILEIEENKHSYYENLDNNIRLRNIK